MHDTMRFPRLVSLVLVSLSLSAPAPAQQAAMTFFITSAGPGPHALAGTAGGVRVTRRGGHALRPRQCWICMFMTS
jgi:hypothetical protein